MEVHVLILPTYSQYLTQTYLNDKWKPRLKPGRIILRIFISAFGISPGIVDFNTNVPEEIYIDGKKCHGI